MFQPHEISGSSHSSKGGPASLALRMKSSRSNDTPYLEESHAFSLISIAQQASKYPIHCHISIYINRYIYIYIHIHIHIHIPEKVGDESQPPNDCSVAKSMRRRRPYLSVKEKKKEKNIQEEQQQKDDSKKKKQKNTLSLAFRLYVSTNYASISAVDTAHRCPRAVFTWTILEYVVIAWA